MKILMKSLLCILLGVILFLSTSGCIYLLLFELPHDAYYKGAADTEYVHEGTATTLLDIYLNGQYQKIMIRRGASVLVTGTAQIWSSGGPSIIKQAFFIVSWTPSWPPPTGYYYAVYNGMPGYHPGVTFDFSFTLTAPSKPGVYFLWFCTEAHYSIPDAVASFNLPLPLPAHAAIIVI